MKRRRSILNVVILALTILFSLLLHNYLQEIINANLLATLINLIFSVAIYVLLQYAFEFIINRSSILLRLYWGKLFMHGLWSYTYLIEGAEEKQYFGVWRFDQTVDSTSVKGFGLNDQFGVRSNVETVLDLYETEGILINLRNDSVDPDKKYYSRTKILFDLPETFSYPITFTSETIIYGGLLTGSVHKDIFTKHEKAHTEADVINDLKAKFAKK